MYREQLLANYLADNPVWQGLIQVYEAAVGNQLDDKAVQLSRIRDLHRLTVEGAAKADAQQMLDATDFELFDRQTMVRICTMLGFGYPNINERLFSTEDYLRIAQNIADYYRNQGTDSFIKFFGYCLNSRFNLDTLWTEDYKQFYAEGDATIALPIWKGGTWYPTSHVNLTFDVENNPLQNKSDLRDFFKYLAPINLVLLHIIESYYATIDLQLAVGGTIDVRGGHKLKVIDLQLAMAGEVQVIDRPAIDHANLIYSMAGTLQVMYRHRPTGVPLFITATGNNV